MAIKKYISVFPREAVHSGERRIRGPVYINRICFKAELMPIHRKRLQLIEKHQCRAIHRKLRQRLFE